MSWSFFTKEGVEKIGEFGVAGLTGGDADTLDGLDSTQYWKKSESISADNLDGYTSGDFLLKAGGAMEGALLLDADPTLPLEAATKQYVDDGLDEKLDTTGGTLTGPLYLPAAGPTTPTQAVNRDYVDDQIAETVPLDGSLPMTGNLELPASGPTLPTHATNKDYVDDLIDATVPLDGSLPMTGHLTLPATNPTNPQHATSKDYVDDGLAAQQAYTDNAVNFAIAGTTIFPLVSVTADYTGTNTDAYIIVDSTTGPIDITLPSASVAGKIFCIKDGTGAAATNAITVVTAGAELIDGVASYDLDTAREWVMLIFDGTNWQVVS